MQASQQDHLASLTASFRDGLGEVVRALLPDLARKVIQEEIDRIRAEEMALPGGDAERIALIRDAFSPLVERIARETTRAMVLEHLPEVAERLVRAEIERIKNG
ncbi:MAG: hypothetical protein HQL99_08115 [Magnetococcales bacterium]|nr:hypothetical protein [Magnetococcales bacterium]